ncbi:hypothetical protein DTO271D3_7529 [Paecilomyces variotii]|nr:hypothetical protein DTO271D3_7529 [Paecilomyces variotii]
MKKFPASSSYSSRREPTLPTPAEIRAINQESGHIRSKLHGRPPPVIIPSQGLLVKYGSNVTTVEAQTQTMLYESLQGQVPIPRVFDWTEDGGQGFIYMSLIEGETLQERWASMSETERRAVCEELRRMVKAWRALKQEGHYIGSLGKKPLNEIFLQSHPDIAGPYEGDGAVQRFQHACGIDITDETPIVFTHGDISPPNILLSRGPNPKVAAIIDWGQAGWYPSYWEYCKARQVGINPKYFDDVMQEEWYTKYLPMILDPVDEERIYHPFVYFVLSKGI